MSRILIPPSSSSLPSSEEKNMDHFFGTTDPPYNEPLSCSRTETESSSFYRNFWGARRVKTHSLWWKHTIIDRKEVQQHLWGWKTTLFERCVSACSLHHRFLMQTLRPPRPPLPPRITAPCVGTTFSPRLTTICSKHRNRSVSPKVRTSTPESRDRH